MKFLAQGEVQLALTLDALDQLSNAMRELRLLICQSAVLHRVDALLIDWPWVKEEQDAATEVLSQFS